MAIFGKIDAKALANDVSVTNNSTTVTTTGDFTNRATADFIQAGDILSLSGVQYTVLVVNSATSLTLTTAYAGSTGTVTAANAIRRTAPKEVANLLINENGQGNKFGPGTQFLFLDTTEAQLEENKIRGLKFPGWWLYRTYVDGDGNTRHKSECIAFVRETSANAGDYDNDNPAADVASAITISVQPSNQTTQAPAGGILTVTQSGTAATGTATYTNVTGTSSGSGTGAKFTVARSGGSYTVTVTSAGSGYAASETITVLGSALGGVDTTNDLTITVSTVATAAATFSVTAAVGTGTVAYQWQVQTAASTTKWTNVAGATSSSLALTGLSTSDSGKKYRVKLSGSAGGEEVISNVAILTVTAA